MELTLYNRLKRKLLGDLAEASEQHDPVWQNAVEAYASKAETGIAKWGRDTIQEWVVRYNKLNSRPIRLRYYQILALYFTEAFLRERRESVKKKAGVGRQNMLAYWMATGSGKTLLMHINILQFIDHIGGFQAFDELQVIVTTPGVNLIEQHRREIVPIIDQLNRQCAGRIKLRVESTGSLLNYEKGFFILPPSSRLFRLVLVDEGHIGLAGGGKELGAFKQLRKDLADYDNAFLFEYSATYHGIAEKHVAEYGEQIVFDYNYYRFYRDGYGKDYSIETVGLDRVAEGKEAWENFQAAFETLADKLRTHDELRLQDTSALGFVSAFADRPLVAFMGNTVEDRKSEGKVDNKGQGADEVSDIRKLLAYLAKLSKKDREKLGSIFHNQIDGPLRLTRCPAVPDEIWLSWGEGQYWGIVNVGNGEKFHADCEGHPELFGPQGEQLVQVRKADIIEPRFLFSEIDRPTSTINVLIGSRKFAEGWNCYRVSVIGLINLGSGKGNKIIQIFGRGVRLHGVNGDGKRRHIEHAENYAELMSDISQLGRLRKLEALNIFSLKASYLETFLKALEEELPRYEVERRVPVSAQALKLGSNSETFDEYAANLPIFKVGREDSEPRLIATLNAGKWDWSFMTEQGPEHGTLERLTIDIDYRPSPEQTPVNLAQDLRNAVEDTPRAAFSAECDYSYRLSSLLDRRKLQLLKNKGQLRRTVAPKDILKLVSSVLYHRNWDTLDFGAQESLIWQVLSEAVGKLHHRLVYDINKRKYRIAEPIVQSQPGEAGDFIGHYDIRVGFKTEVEKKNFEQTYPSPILPAQFELTFNGSRHIYKPLLRNAKDKGVAGLNLQTISISPDSLNPGERKFVEDLQGFLSNPARQGSVKNYSFYLMRNVESLRSVGVYLDTESRAYFPDFVLWAVSSKETHILLVDPKGQSGIMDWASLTGGVNAKVSLAKSSDLVELGRSLSSATGKSCKVSSFILLRKSSPLGKANGASYNPKDVAELERHHVLHLDWAPAVGGKHIDEDGNLLPKPPDGRCYVERMFSLAGVLN